MTERLSPPSLLLARRYAKAQVSDPQILATLRAHAREAIDDPSELSAVLLGLQVFHDSDAEDLDDFRALGRAVVQLVIFAAAVGERLNSDLEPGDSEEHREVSGMAASMAQFFARVFCVIDPGELADEASKAARRIADLSDAEVKEQAAELARACGLRVVDDGAAA